MLVGLCPPPSDNFVNALQYILIFAFAAALSCVSCKMTCALPSDTQIVYDSAAALLKQGTLNVEYDFSTFYPELGYYTLADYYCRSSNNIMLLLIITAVYAVGAPLGVEVGTADGQWLAVFATALSVAVAVHMLCKSVQHIFKRPVAYFQCLALNALFLCYYYSCPNFYTDIWILCPIFCGLYFAVRFFETQKKHFAVVCSLFWSIACELKVTSAIMLIALCIYLILRKQSSPKEKATLLLLFTLPFFAYIFVFHAWYHHCGLFDFSRYEELYYPWTVWLSFGSHGQGGYHYEDAVFAYKTPFEQRDKAVAEHIKEIFSSYTFSEYLRFLKNKLSFVLGDGLFEGGEYAYWALFQNWTNKFTNPLYVENSYALMWADSFTLMLWCCGAATSLLQIKRRDNSWLLFVNIAIFGFIFYLSLFEAAPRRMIPAMLLLMVDAVYLLRRFGEAICDASSRRTAANKD